MKRLFTLLLAALLLVSLCACSQEPGPASTEGTVETKPLTKEDKAKNYKVPSPMAYPDYTFSGTPTTTQLRETAVKAMKDLLSIQWCTVTNIAYYKSGPVNNKRFEHKPENTYGGTIYSNASTGLFQFMEYYNTETGMLEYPYKMSQMQHDIGNSCADSLLWGWSTVCNSISAGYFPVFMVHRNGYLPVGGYTYNFKISSYNEFPTQKVIQSNGDEVILNAYAQALPADALVSSTANHAMMVIEAPRVVYNDDGTINANDSTVAIQDQRGGDGNGFYDAIENGNVIHYSGRTYYRCTFAWLLEKHYVPVTCAEFTGEKPYEKATITASQSCTTLEQVKATTISSNYPLAVIRVTVTDETGKEEVWGRKLFGGAKETGVPTSYALSELECWKTAAYSPLNKAGNKLRIDVVTPAGETFTPIKITL